MIFYQTCASRRTPPTVLPQKYYLKHAYDLIAFIESECKHLLKPAHFQFIERFKGLDDASRCLLLRIYSRSKLFIEISSLHYDEIPCTEAALQHLEDAGLTTRVMPEVVNELISSILTKKKLIKLYDELTEADLFFVSSESHNTSVRPSNSADKKAWIKACLAVANPSAFAIRSICAEYILNTRDHAFEYFEFLYFGRIDRDGKYSSNAFSLRDLGLINTNQDVVQNISRFESVDEAESSFYWSKKYVSYQRGLNKHSSKNHSSRFTVEFSEDVLNSDSSAVGELAMKSRGKLVLLLAKHLRIEYPDILIRLLPVANDNSEVQEMLVRERYKRGEKKWVEAALKMHINYPISDEMLFFAEDFYQRKFKQKPISKITELLRNSTCRVEIDEIYRGSVELGVVTKYRQQGLIAYRTENEPWLQLFALVFWLPLYVDTPNAVCTEFDFLPPALQSNTFYEDQSNQIERILKSFKDVGSIYVLVQSHAASFYGKPNGLFKWNSYMLEQLRVLITKSTLSSLVSHLRNMARQFNSLRDGYPDLMIEHRSSLRFEEVKADGDKLRRNQLLTIESLKASGFDVGILSVKWIRDSSRTYSVVDIETTGGRSEAHRITEIAVVRLQNGEIIDRWNSLVNPQRSIPASIAKLTGITNAMVAKAPLFSELVDPLLERLQGTLFVAHNVNFDYGFIRSELKRCGFSFKMPKLCTVVQARKIFPGLRSYSLANLSNYFEIELSHHHRALADASATAELLKLIHANS